MQVEPLDATFGAVVRDIELVRLDDETWRELHSAWLEHALLIFPGQHLTTDEQDAFALRFGALEFKASPISNISKSGKVHAEPHDDVVKSLRGNEGWHHDSTYMEPSSRTEPVIERPVCPGFTYSSTGRLTVVTTSIVVRHAPHHI